MTTEVNSVFAWIILAAVPCIFGYFLGCLIEAKIDATNNRSIKTMKSKEEIAMEVAYAEVNRLECLLRKAKDEADKAWKAYVRRMR